MTWLPFIGLTGCLKALGKPAMPISQFLGSKRPEALPYKDLAMSQVATEGNNCYEHHHQSSKADY
jgi:hypothetical protein